MNIILWLVVGGLMGWVASVFTGTNDRPGIILNVVAGVIGATIGGWLFGGASASNQGGLSINDLCVSILGAVIVIGATGRYRESTYR